MSVELVLVTPVLLALLLFVVLGGRLAQARADVDGAAREATAAEAAGLAAARARLSEGRPTCRDLDVAVDASGFTAGGLVTATVSCTVGLGDLSGLGVPGTRVVASSFTEVVDAYRGTA